MGSWQLVVPYDERATEFLAREGLPHPELSVGNRSPTVRELMSIEHPGVVFDIVEDLRDPDAVLERLRLRGESDRAELAAVYALAAMCGQQWLYPDSGLPGIVVDPSIELDRALHAWERANAREDGWEWLFHELYSG